MNLTEISASFFRFDDHDAEAGDQETRKSDHLVYFLISDSRRLRAVRGMPHEWTCCEIFSLRKVGRRPLVSLGTSCVVSYESKT